MKAIFINKSILFNGKSFLIDDLFNDSFYCYSNSLADAFFNETYGVNEVFINLIQPFLALQKWAEENIPNVVDIKKADKCYKFLITDIFANSHTTVKGITLCHRMWTFLSFHAIVFASAVDILLLQCKIKQTGTPLPHEKFAVLRHKGAIKKFKRFNEIYQEIESLYSKNSIYRLFPLSKRLRWVFKAYFRSYNSFSLMNSFYASLIGKNFKYAMMDFYKKRIVYAELYRLMLDDYFSFYEGKEFYTGNNLDRYSVIEDQMCFKHHIKSYNIPHGIEYGFKFPKGFSSDVFYVHSQYTADYLNNLYSTKKYKYDEYVIRKMFHYGYVKPHETMVIFFTEPREVHVNLDIINELLPKLREKGIPLYLKLHPGDNKLNYAGIDINYISDYELSLTGNICISRKSTILLEAIYNNSFPIAIITNPKDQTMFDLFPSLNAKEIVKTYTVNELYNVIINYLCK